MQKLNRDNEIVSLPKPVRDLTLPKILGPLDHANPLLAAYSQSQQQVTGILPSPMPTNYILLSNLFDGNEQQSQPTFYADLKDDI